MEHEIWKTAQYHYIDGRLKTFKDYEISNYGRCKSLKHGKTRILKPGATIDSALHYTYVLSEDGKRYTLSAHRLTLSTFRPKEYKKGRVIDHITPRSETTCDNFVGNLRFVTVKQNTDTDHRRESFSATMKGRLINRPDRSKKVKVTFPDGSQKIFDSAREVSRSLDLPPRCVSYVIKCQDGYYKKLGLHFRYL